MNLMRALSILSVLLVTVLFIRLWAGAGSYPAIWELQERIERQRAQNEAQRLMNERLEADVSEISRDNAAIEDHARSELGMIKKGETFYQIILREDSLNSLNTPLANTPKTKKEAAYAE